MGGDKNIYSSFLLQVVRGILDVSRRLDGKLSQAEKQQYEACEEEDAVCVCVSKTVPAHLGKGGDIVNNCLTHQKLNFLFYYV